MLGYVDLKMELKILTLWTIARRFSLVVGILANGRAPVVPVLEVGIDFDGGFVRETGEGEGKGGGDKCNCSKEMHCKNRRLTRAEYFKVGD